MATINIPENYQAVMPYLIVKNGAQFIGFTQKVFGATEQFKTMRMVEIANELGFNDESHLNRIFKKYRSMNPSDFRKAGGELNALV